MLLILLGASLLFGQTRKDSLEQAVISYRGIPRIDAHLKLAFDHRRSDFEVSRKHALTAAGEAGELRERNREAQALYYLGLTYHYHNLTDSALYFLYQSRDLFFEEDNIEQLGKVYSMIGTCYLSTTGDQEQAVVYYNASLHYSRRASDHMTMAIVYSQLSNIFRMNGAYEQSIEFVYKSKEQYEKAGYAEGIAWVNFSIGRIYITMGLYEEAEQALLRGLETYRAQPDDIPNRTGIAICLDELALVYVELGDPGKAERHNSEALEIYRELKNAFGISNALKHKARIEYVCGDRDEAEVQLGESLRIKKRVNDVLGLPAIYSLFGQILSDQGRFSDAIDSLYVGLEHALNNDQKTRIVDLNMQLSKVFYKMGDFQKAYDHQLRQIVVMDAIYGSKATRGMTQLESLYELEAKEKRIESLQQDNLIKELELRRQKITRNLLLIILILVVIFTLLIMRLFIDNRRARIELEKSREKLQELNATKDKFFSIIAHDLKSPFNTIIGFSTLMERYSKEKDFQKIGDFSGHIREVSIQTFNLLENLLDWSRAQTGKINFSPKPIDIRVSIQNAVDLLHPQAEHKEVRIEIDAASHTVHADENMIHTVFQNLISNAIKYSHPGGRIWIKADEENNMLTVSICDEGVGMDEETRANLFRLEVNTSRPGTDGEKGTGLGLILCKEFIRKHGGDISVAGKPGEGTCFTLRIPKTHSQKVEK
ncbi:MAG: tetratricopeptide repeat protein [FCB group bacterium]|nr:tetratricopeptide repeat protein [FCB group bacterium]